MFGGFLGVELAAKAHAERLLQEAEAERRAHEGLPCQPPLRERACAAAGAWLIAAGTWLQRRARPIPGPEAQWIESPC